jgi:solute carrier family 25 (mitochondrial carnitine/acylcarnitine transporter), member 20/29
MNNEPPHRAKVAYIPEFIASALAGVSNIIVGQPFDIVKTRIQSEINSGQKTRSSFSHAYQILTQEGITTFYKGSAALCLSMALGNSYRFVSYEVLKKNLNVTSHRQMVTPYFLFFFLFI